MNKNLLGVLQKIASEHGEDILNNPRQVQGLFECSHMKVQ